MKHIYTSLDIGSDSIKIVVCELFQQKLTLLAASSVKSKGIRKGLIIDENAAASAVRNAVDNVEAMLGIKIDKLVTNVPGDFAEFTLVKGELKIRNPEKIISADDTMKVLHIAAAPKLKSNPSNEVVTILPIDFSINNNGNVTNPVGFKGDLISCRAILATVPRKNVYSVITMIEKLGIEVVDISINCINDMMPYRSNDINNKLGIIVNLGAETTTISMYNKGIIVKSTIVGLGGKNIDQDISYIYKIEQEEAKKIKEKFATALKDTASPNEAFEIVNLNNQKIRVSQKSASEVVGSRVEEILNIIKNEINVLTNKQLQYIIFTGGTSNLRDFNYVLDEFFHQTATIGNIKIVGLRNNKYATAVGGIIYFINKLKLKNEDYTMLDSADVLSISSPKRNSNDSSTSGNESMLNKVFGYFFGE